ncbi:MAG: hypothetical protein FJY97_00915 [candidate division Zixibacteria bacterium]|nr:hypothetical protein [candidate division Zixibacteria bacterium]
MATYTLTVRIDRSIPFHKLATLPRFWGWDEADRLSTADRTLTLHIVMPDEFAGLSPRWDDVYGYGATTETDTDGQPIFRGFPTGTVSVQKATAELGLQPGVNYVRVERSGGIVRDYRGGEPVPGTSVWSKAKVSGYLIVTVEG